jgi:hypothetical protein
MAALTVQEHIKEAELLLKSVKEKIHKYGNLAAESDLDNAMNHLADARRKAAHKGRAGFYAGQTR